MSDGPATGPTPEEIRRRRGYELDFHRILTAADPEWAPQYAAFVEATASSTAEGWRHFVRSR